MRLDGAAGFPGPRAGPVGCCSRAGFLSLVEEEGGERFGVGQLAGVDEAFEVGGWYELGGELLFGGGLRLRDHLAAGQVDVDSLVGEVGCGEQDAEVAGGVEPGAG